MDKVKLELDFLDGLGKRFRLSIEDPDENIDSIQIEEAMDEILQLNIFESNASDLAGVEGARIIRTSVEEIKF